LLQACSLNHFISNGLGNFEACGVRKQHQFPFAVAAAVWLETAPHGFILKSM
jgi:hypothetical protein